MMNKYGLHNNIQNKKALNVTLLIAKYHIFSTNACDGKLTFESFLIRFRHYLTILKERYTSKNQLYKFISMWGKFV